MRERSPRGPHYNRVLPRPSSGTSTPQNPIYPTPRRRALLPGLGPDQPALARRDLRCDPRGIHRSAALRLGRNIANCGVVTLPCISYPQRHGRPRSPCRSGYDGRCRSGRWIGVPLRVRLVVNRRCETGQRGLSLFRRTQKAVERIFPNGKVSASDNML